VPCAGHQAATTASSNLAAETVEALHAALADDEQGRHLVLRTHSPSGAYIGRKPEAGFAQTFTNLASQLTAQLTAAACLARLCLLVSMLHSVKSFSMLAGRGGVIQCSMCAHAQLKDMASLYTTGPVYKIMYTGPVVALLALSPKVSHLLMLQ
jgi:hypothetical protein